MRAEGPDALTLVDWDSRQARVIEQSSVRVTQRATRRLLASKQPSAPLQVVRSQIRSRIHDPVDQANCSLGSDEDFSAVAVVELHPPAKILAL
jgi:hypothetical protein